MVAILVLAVASVPTVAVAARRAPGNGQISIRASIPAIEAYYADHGTYAGMTLEKLRRSYDYGLKNIVVRRATKHYYCVQSTRGGLYHFVGPVGPMRAGACP